MSNKTSNIEKSSGHVTPRQKNLNQMNQEWKRHLLKMTAITVVIIILAIVSVSDGQLISSRVDTSIANQTTGK